MSAHVADLMAARDRATAKADSILRRIEESNRKPTANELETINQCTREAADHSGEIARLQARQRLTEMRSEITPLAMISEQGNREKVLPKSFPKIYGDAFLRTLKPAGLSGLSPEIQAALDEGSSTAGGYAVPSIVDDAGYVPLAPTDLAVRRLATVITTQSDRKIPRTDVLPVAATKAETAQASESDSTMGQFTLGSNFLAVRTDASVELLADLVIFLTFYGNDINSGLGILEEGYFINGTGSGQPQGLLGNIGTGVTGATADGQGNLLSIDATYAVLPTLKDAYHDNASWLMTRTTALELRRAQVQANYFEKVFRRENGRDTLHGYPVNYSASMPAIAAGATPVLFGDFKAGYIIGDRGGSGLFVKAVTQDAQQALKGLTVLLGYRRVDGKVRRSEAIQGITLHT